MDKNKINSVSIDEVAIKHHIYIVRSDSPAWKVFKKICKTYRPGMIIPVSQEEFESLKNEVLIIQTDGKELG